MRTVIYGTYKANHPNACTTVFNDEEGNIKLLAWRSSGGRMYEYMDVIKDTTGEMFKDVVKEAFGSMKFDVIIGNPPYQEMTSGGGTGKMGKALFPYFVFRAKEVLGKEEGKLVMIMPTRWYSQKDNIYIKLREELMDGHLKRIFDFPNANECFEGVSIAGGVSYFIYDKGHWGLTELRSGKMKWCMDYSKPEMILRDGIASNINKRIINTSQGEKNFGDVVSSTDMFGILRSFRGSVIETEDCNIKLKHSEGYGYISREDIRKNINQLMNYKIITGYMNGSTNKVLGSVEVLGPNEVCTLTYLVLGVVRDRQMAENIKRYFETKFVRFLIKATVSNITLTRNNYSVVPLQNFTELWTDEKLYKKYKLTKDEIEHIENTIKSMS